ncbi:MAG: hypothetical protein JSW26_18925 [Desulfobacterales bacterium]|nr:MAG: hypothetical protein JSW26_18925 [Desulfobacterales bacterium]
MDSNLMSCPTCGHAVSNAAGACAYCGSIISVGEQKEQTNDQIAAEETKPTESATPLLSAEMLPEADMSDETDMTRDAVEEPFEPMPTQETLAEPAAVESPEPEPEAESPADIATTEGESRLEFVSPEKEQALAPDPDPFRQSPDSESNFETASTEAAEPEAVSLSEPAPAGHYMLENEAAAVEKSLSAEDTGQTDDERTQAESGPEEDPLSPQAGGVDLATEGPVESETPGAEILESESLGDTILLEPADEVQTPVKKSPDKVKERAKMPAPKPTKTAKAGFDAPAAENKRQADVLKIVKGAQEMAAAIEKQKEKTAEVENLSDKRVEADKIQELKKQKAALAKAQAKKKQKLLLAKAAALKRKKAAEAKAQALKKQSESQSAIETAKNKEFAAAGPRQADTPTDIARPLEVNSKMLNLLKKYEGQAIGINYDNSAEIKEALLEGANSDYFSVFVRDKNLQYNYPLKSILTVIEGKDGVDGGNSKQPTKFNAVIKVYPLVLF